MKRWLAIGGYEHRDCHKHSPGACRLVRTHAEGTCCPPALYISRLPREVPATSRKDTGCPCTAKWINTSILSTCLILSTFKRHCKATAGIAYPYRYQHHRLRAFRSDTNTCWPPSFHQIEAPAPSTDPPWLLKPPTRSRPPSIWASPYRTSSSSYRLSSESWSTTTSSTSSRMSASLT